MVLSHAGCCPAGPHHASMELGSGGTGTLGVCISHPQRLCPPLQHHRGHQGPSWELLGAQGWAGAMQGPALTAALRGKLPEIQVLQLEVDKGGELARSYPGL